MINQPLIQAFMRDFYGYGTLEAPYWLIGIEEAGDGSTEDLSSRLTAWDRHGRPEIDDLSDFCRDAGIHISRTTPQRTWRPLIHLMLAAKGEPISSSSVLDYQLTRLGRGDGETCLLELLPLPKRNANDWPYGGWTDLPELSSRSTYENQVTEKRVEHIVTAIHDRQPRAAVFYGRRKFWRARLNLPDTSAHLTFDAGNIGVTAVVATDHPVARTNDGARRFTDIGNHLRMLLGRKL